MYHVKRTVISMVGYKIKSGEVVCYQVKLL